MRKDNFFRIFDKRGSDFKMYKEVVLDDSILDLDSWLPQSAVDEVVALILHLEELEGATQSVSLK